MDNYDEVYRKPGFYWGRTPNEFCSEVMGLIPQERINGARLVDLGSGEGRDLIQFASKGLDVTGVDLSSVGLGKAKRWAEDEGLSIRTVIGDLNTFRLEGMFDVVYSSGSLTYINEGNRKGAFENFKAHTAIGGLNAFNAFVFNASFGTPPDWGTGESFFRKGELLSYYREWEIVKSYENIFDCSSGGVPHRHEMETVIARKI